MKWLTLDVPGYQNRPVPHTFMRQEARTDHLGIVYPGYRYRATMPVLYYSAGLLLDRGADVLRVETAYDACADWQALSQAERDRWFAADAEGACAAALAQRAYRRVTLVGKSIGTLAVGHLVSACAVLDSLETGCVWLTPLLRDERLCAQMARAAGRALFVSGTADPHYALERLAELERVTGGQSVVIEGADHSLEVAGDVPGSLRAMERVVTALVRFLDEGGDAHRA